MVQKFPNHKISKRKGKTSSRNQEINEVAIKCDRCFHIVHYVCSKDSGILIPSSNTPHYGEPYWFCSECIKDAPISVNIRKKEIESGRRKRRNSTSFSGNKLMDENKLNSNNRKIEINKEKLL